MRKFLESSLQNAITKVIVIEHQLTCHTFNKSVCQVKVALNNCVITQ